MGTPAMDFRILGPLEVQGSDGPLALGGTRQRALLAVLLLHANEVVSSDRLIEDLWGDEQPKEAPKALQVAVSRLRRSLEPEAGGLLMTRPPGYALQVERDQLDLHRFEDLVDAGRAAMSAGDPAAAAAKIDDALALWRGPPLGDLAYEPFLQRDIARLDELRVAALEDRVAANLQLGRHAEVIAELESLVTDHPMRERLREQLMLALYRSGRQADALAAFRDARTTLVDELGIEPGHRLRDLNEQILMQDPALDPPAVAKPAAVAPRGVFVGRERERAVLGTALADALAGRGQVVMIAGEPGIGKSRLADEVIRDAEARGARVLIGRCWEAGGAPAYWPWVQSLRTCIRDTAPEVLRAQLGTGASDLAQLLPELREMFPELPEPAAPDSEGARFRLFGAVSSFLRDAGQAGPLVLVLDDLHAADEPSLLLLRLIAREMANSRLLLVCAYRDVDPTLGHALSATLAELMREPHTTRLALAGLQEADVARYIELSTGVDPAPALARAIHHETDGNPFFVGGVVQLLDDEGRLSESDAYLRIPPEVRAVIGERVGRLSEPCRDLLVPAAVIGREFGLDALGAVSGLPGDEALDVLHEAMAEQVVDEVPGTPGRLRFGHALIRDTLYDDLTPARRIQLHRQAGDALETLYSSDIEPHLAELARHFLAAAPAGSADKAEQYARRAGDRAATQLAHEEAVRHYKTALTLAHDQVARCELLLALGDAQGRAGDTPASQRSFRDAAQIAEELGLADHLARAALGYGGRFLWDVSRDDATHLRLLERALAALGEADSTLRVRLLARLAGGPLRDASFSPARRRSLSQEAVDTARRIDDHGALAYALSCHIAANHSPTFTKEQVTLATELIQVAVEVGDLERVAEGHEHRFTAMTELGDMTAARADFAAMSSLAEELRQPPHYWFIAVYRAIFALLEGQLAVAEDLIGDALKLGERAQSWSAAVSYGLQMYVLRRAQGRLEEVEGLVRRAAGDYPTYPVWRCVLTEMTARLGPEAEARQLLDTLAVDRFGALTFDEEWLVSTGFLAEAAHTLGDADTATVLYDMLAPFADRIAFAYPEISTGSVARYLGLLATTLERWHEAAGHFEQAIETHERIGARSWLAHTWDDYARMLEARGRPGDHDRAVELGGLARRGYEQLGMDTFAAAVAQSLPSAPSSQ